MSLLRKAILVNSTEFICLALGAFRTAVLSRVLGPAGIGQYAVVLSALVLAGPLSSFGFPLSFLYYSQHDRDNVKVYLINTISSMLVLGAAGGIEAIYTVLAIYHSVVPPTANYATPDPDCPLDYTTDGARERSIRYALSNSFGFGGQNACLAFSGVF